MEKFLEKITPLAGAADEEAVLQFMAEFVGSLVRAGEPMLHFLLLAFNFHIGPDLPVEFRSLQRRVSFAHLIEHRLGFLADLRLVVGRPTAHLAAWTGWYRHREGPGKKTQATEKQDPNAFPSPQC